MVVGFDDDFHWVGLYWYWFLVHLDHPFWFACGLLQCRGVILVVNGDVMIEGDIVDDGIIW